MSYEEDDRRAQTTDHDLIVKISTNLETHMESFNEHREVFKDHIKSDADDFRTLYRFMWVVTGAFCVIEVFLKIFK